MNFKLAWQPSCYHDEWEKEIKGVLTSFFHCPLTKPGTEYSIGIDIQAIEGH